MKSCYDSRSTTLRECQSCLPPPANAELTQCRATTLLQHPPNPIVYWVAVVTIFPRRTRSNRARGQSEIQKERKSVGGFEEKKRNDEAKRKKETDDIIVFVTTYGRPGNCPPLLASDYKGDTVPQTSWFHFLPFLSFLFNNKTKRTKGP